MAPEAAVLACPGLKNGNVHVELYDKGQTSIIPAHNNPLSQLALNSDGSLLVTCSDKGTLVRVFDTESGTQIKEFRRGATKAEIYSLAFNANSTAVVVSSERGTIHIYGLPPRTSEQSAEEAKSNKSSKYGYSNPQFLFHEGYSPELLWKRVELRPVSDSLPLHLLFRPIQKQCDLRVR